MKPGEVARVLGERGNALAMWSGVNWQVAGGSVGKILDARPLLLIDPEDYGQVEQLVDAALNHGYTFDGTGGDMQGALSSLLAPPKPEEPTEPGTVVTDVNGDRHMRLFKHGEHTGIWLGEDGVTRRWDAVEVLSPGVGGAS